VLSGLAALQRDRDYGRETVNHHVRAVRAFARWLWKEGRAREHLLAHLATVNPESDRRHRRRALTDEESARLVTAAESGPSVKGMIGPDRAMLYRVALGTGFRADELRSLMTRSFRLGEPPTIICEAAYTKNGQVAEQPISGALADLLERWLAGKPADRPVFNLGPCSAEMMRVDLAAAGIPYRDDSGRVADFHSLHHTYISALARSRAPVKVVQSLARHSTPTLTLAGYAHVELHDQAAALSALPDLTARLDAPEAASVPRTGTDGRSISNRLAPHLPHAGDGEGRNETVAGGNADIVTRESQGTLMMQGPLDSRASGASGRTLAAPDGDAGAEKREIHAPVKSASQRISKPMSRRTWPPCSMLSMCRATAARPSGCTIKG
jgi:integrase